ncbi:melanoma-associated antigen 8-like [Cavia porcellus]|uniref:melanoma-associated antigen 8-like n=1 Tax=Cavia porcellus TaxID=10141 RepID=UPI00022B24F1|nr:melanoma-associated antigen 8-like [Cavia porcellus]
MHRSDKSQDKKLRGRHPDHSSARILMDVQGPKDEEGAAATASSAPFSRALFGATSRKENPQSPQSIPFPLNVMASSEGSQSCEGSSREDEGPSTSEDKDLLQFLQRVFANDKLDKILRFLLQKYQKKEQITKAEMLHILDRDYHDHFPLIFPELCECMRLGFGIIMKEVSPSGQRYELVPVLGLTYSGMLDDDEHIIPKADLLILILSVIFLKGNQVSEEHLREMLRYKQILAERENVVFGDPWKFITEDLVREGYILRQQVPNSSPARYEFLWGPRAHAETTKLKVLEHVFALDGLDSRACPQSVSSV